MSPGVPLLWLRVIHSVRDAAALSLCRYVAITGLEEEGVPWARIVSGNLTNAGLHVMSYHVFLRTTQRAATQQEWNRERHETIIAIYNDDLYCNAQ